jgi:hypothetical protein
VRSRIVIAVACLVALLAATIAFRASAGDGANQAGARTPKPSTSAVPDTLIPTPEGCGTASEILVPSCGAWLGMWPRTRADGTKTADLKDNLKSLERRADRKFDIVSRYYGWGEQLPDATDQGWRDAGRIVLIDLRARNFITNEQVKWADIAAGKHDAYLRGVAENLKAFGAKVFFSFNQEPEAELEKGIGVAGSADDYADAYRHIHSLFEQAGATNVIWVWWVMGYLGHVGWYPALYPGDKYVDWVSYDPYDFNRCRDASNETPAQTILPFLNWLVVSATAKGKPVMLSEFGSHGDDRGDWYRGVGELIKKTPRIKAIIPFNSQPATGTCDFRVTAAPGKWAGFATIARDPFFNQALPKG